jgi:hypothetical protein
MEIVQQIWRENSDGSGSYYSYPQKYLDLAQALKDSSPERWTNDIYWLADRIADADGYFTSMGVRVEDRVSKFASMFREAQIAYRTRFLLEDDFLSQSSVIRKRRRRKGELLQIKKDLLAFFASHDGWHKRKDIPIQMLPSDFSAAMRELIEERKVRQHGKKRGAIYAKWGEKSDPPAKKVKPPKEKKEKGRRGRKPTKPDISLAVDASLVLQFIKGREKTSRSDIMERFGISGEQWPDIRHAIVSGGAIQHGKKRGAYYTYGQ